MNIQPLQLSESMLQEATKVYRTHFDGRTWYGRCIFLSWYCSLGDCTFCFRSTTSHKKKFRDGAKRSKASVALEALFCRIFGWRIEFITGGYGMMPYQEVCEYLDIITKVYGEKLWINLGALTSQQIDAYAPYIKGVCASIETCTPALHKKVCPSKPIKPYEKMFGYMQKKYPLLKKSIAIIIGMGTALNEEDTIEHLFSFIEKHSINRITMYALKPVRGTAFTQAPTTEEFAAWIARVRIRFPELQIIAGTNLRRFEEIDILMKAGANAITKFPATKQFATENAKKVEQLVTKENREFTSNLAQIPSINWHDEIEKLDINIKLKDEMKVLLNSYLYKFSHPTTKEGSYCSEE